VIEAKRGLGPWQSAALAKSAKRAGRSYRRDARLTTRCPMTRAACSLRTAATAPGWVAQSQARGAAAISEENHGGLGQFLMLVDVLEHRSKVGPAKAPQFPGAVGAEGLVAAEGLDFLDFNASLSIFLRERTLNASELSIFCARGLQPPHCTTFFPRVIRSVTTPVGKTPGTICRKPTARRRPAITHGWLTRQRIS